MSRLFASRSSFLLCCGFLLSTAAAQQTDLARQKAALQKACSSGALTPQECQQRIAALQPTQSSGQSGQADSAAQAQGGGGQTYREPRGRFSIVVPSGWQVDTSQGNLKLTNGKNWATFDTLSNSGQPLSVVQNAANQMQPMVSNWKVVKQGPFTGQNGHPAAGITASASVPTRTGTQSQMFLFISLGAGAGNYVLMTASTDAAQKGQPIDALLGAFGSIRFAGE